MIIRRYEPKDCKALVELFYDTVHSVNAKDYTKEQLCVWATGIVDLEAWNQSLLKHFSVVEVKDEIIVGFGDIDKSGYLDRLYVHKDYQNKGVATAICDELERSFQVDKIIHILQLQQGHFLKEEDTKSLRNRT